MEEIQKKTRKASTAKKQENEAKENKTKKQTKTTKKAVEAKPTKVAKEAEKAKTAKAVKEVAETKQTKAIKEAEVKKATKAVKEKAEKKPTKAVKKVADKKEVKTEKEQLKNKTSKVVKEEVEKKPVKAVTKKVEEKAIGEARKSQKENKTSTKTKESKKIKAEKKETQKGEKKEKKYVDISIGSVACIIVILGLLTLNIKLGIHAYNIISERETANSEIELNDSNTTQEIGNVLSSSNEIIPKIIEKITFSPSVTASIYNAETFNAENIPNDLKLKIGWAKTEDESKLKSINENNESVEVIEKVAMEETIKKIFGPEANYKDETIDYSKVSTFAPNNKKIIYNSGIYTNTIPQVEEERIPFIYQEVQKVVKYSNQVIVYVKAAYMNVENGKYVAYKEFNSGNFTDKLLEITPEELFNDVSFNASTGEGAISINTNSALDSIRSKLHTYKYTFAFNETTKEYYLSEFCQEQSEI